MKKPSGLTLNRYIMPYHAERFKVNTATFHITVEKYAVNNDFFVRTERFREFPSLGHSNFQEWINDTRFLCDKLSTTNLDLGDYNNALLTICVYHKNKFGRLIDSDLYNYIDDMLLIIEAIFNMNGGRLPLEVGKQQWYAFQNFIFNKMAPDIWVHQPSMNPLEKTRLVRLTDLPINR